MPDVKRTVRIITEQHVIGKDSGVEGYPMRSWNIRIVLVHENTGEDVTANKPPFKIQEEGWGEFDMRIVVTGIDKGGDHELLHDLNFQQERYEAEHKITFKNPKPNLLEKLKESGPVGGEENGVKSKRADDSAKKRKRPEKGVDMEKLADSLQRLGEEDLLQVVEMVHNNKTADTYTKNDVERTKTTNPFAQCAKLTNVLQRANSTSTFIPYPTA
ncbi:MAG: hypothetical protein Q9225_000649 [Loekoesia sp. 1 TL-2023]